MFLCLCLCFYVFSADASSFYDFIVASDAGCSTPTNEIVLSEEEFKPSETMFVIGSLEDPSLLPPIREAKSSGQ